MLHLLHSNEEIGTPLTCAAEHGHEDVVDYLLKSGADVDGKFLDDKNIEVCKYSIDVHLLECSNIFSKLSSNLHNVNSNGKSSKLMLTMALHIKNFSIIQKALEPAIL